MIDFLRARGPEIGRFVLIILALILAFLIGQRSVEGHTPTPVVAADATFRAFELPDPPRPPTLRSGCCIPDTGLHEYGVPVERPAPTASPPEQASRHHKASPEAGHTASRSGARTIRRTGHGDLGGYATWFATGRNGLYGAAGPALRRAIGKGWRGSHVLVAYGHRAVEVTLNDWCACGPRNGVPTLIDLSDEAFRAITATRLYPDGRLGMGVVRVAIDVP